MAAAIDRLADHMAAARSRQGASATRRAADPLADLSADDAVPLVPAPEPVAPPEPPPQRGGRASLLSAERHSALARVRDRRARQPDDEVPTPPSPPSPLSPPSPPEPRSPQYAASHEPFAHRDRQPALRLPAPAPGRPGQGQGGGATASSSSPMWEFGKLQDAIARELEVAEAGLDDGSSTRHPLAPPRRRPPLPPAPEVQATEAAAQAGNSASSTAPPPPTRPHKPPPIAGDGPSGSLRPSRPPPSSQGRSVIAALRQVRDDEARRCRRLAEVQAEGKRRSMLEEEHAQQAAVNRAPGSSRDGRQSSAEPESGHSSPSESMSPRVDEQRSPARLMLQRRLELRRDARRAPAPPAASPSPLVAESPEPRVSQSQLGQSPKAAAAEAAGCSVQQLISWQDLLGEGSADDEDADVVGSTMRRRTRTNSGVGFERAELGGARSVASDRAELGGARSVEDLRKTPICRHSSCSDYEGKDCAISMASTASTFRPARSASSSPPHGARSPGCDESSYDDQSLSSHVTSAAATPTPAPDLRASFLAGMADVSGMAGAAAVASPWDSDGAFLSELVKSGSHPLLPESGHCLPHGQSGETQQESCTGSEMKQGSQAAGRRNLSEQEEAALAVLRKRQAARFAARGQVVASEQSQSKRTAVVDTSPKAHCASSTHGNERRSASVPLNAIIFEEGNSSVEDRSKSPSACKVAAEVHSAEIHVTPLALESSVSQSQLVDDASTDIGHIADKTYVAPIARECPLTISDTKLHVGNSSELPSPRPASPPPEPDVQVLSASALTSSRIPLSSPPPVVGEKNSEDHMPPDVLETKKSSHRMEFDTGPMSTQDETSASIPLTGAELPECEVSAVDATESPEAPPETQGFPGDTACPSSDLCAAQTQDDVAIDDELNLSPSRPSRPSTRRGSRGEVANEDSFARSLEAMLTSGRENPHEIDLFSSGDSSSSVEMLWQAPSHSNDVGMAYGRYGFEEEPRIGLPLTDHGYSMPPCDAAVALGVSDDCRFDSYGLDSSGEDSLTNLCIEPPGELELCDQFLPSRDLYVIAEEESLRSSTAGGDSLRASTAGSIGSNVLHASPVKKPVAAVDKALVTDPKDDSTGALEKLLDSEAVLIASERGELAGGGHEEQNKDTSLAISELDEIILPSESRRVYSPPWSAEVVSVSKMDSPPSSAEGVSEDHMVEHYLAQSLVADLLPPSSSSSSDADYREHRVPTPEVADMTHFKGADDGAREFSPDDCGTASRGECKVQANPPEKSTVDGETSLHRDSSTTPLWGVSSSDDVDRSSAFDEGLVRNVPCFSVVSSDCKMHQCSVTDTALVRSLPSSSAVTGDLTMHQCSVTDAADSENHQFLASSGVELPRSTTATPLGADARPEREQWPAEALTCEAGTQQIEEMYTIAIEEDAEWASALRIQSAYRAYRSRAPREQKPPVAQPPELEPPVPPPPSEPVPTHAEVRRASVVNAAKSLAALRSQVQKQTEWQAALRVQSCWRGHSTRRYVVLELRRRSNARKAGGSSSGRRQHSGTGCTERSGSRRDRDRDRSSKDSGPAEKISEPKAGKKDSAGPRHSVDEARHIAQRRVKSARGTTEQQRPGSQRAGDQKAQAGSSGRRRTVSELLQEEAGAADALPKIPGAARRTGSREAGSRATTSPPSADVAELARQSSRGSSVPRSRRPSPGTGKRCEAADARQEGSERLPEAVTPRNTSAVARSPRTPINGALAPEVEARRQGLGTPGKTIPKAVAAAAESAQACLHFGLSPESCCSASPRRTWG